jgi:type I restriction enzyme, S subunit
MSKMSESKSWRFDNLSSLLNRVIDYRGMSVPKSNVGIPLITAKNVRDGMLDFSTNEFVDETAYAEWKSRGVPAPGDVLFTTEAPLGKVAPFPLHGEYAIGQRVVALRPKPRVLDSGYLLQFLLSPIGKKRVELFSTGSTAKGISSRQLHKIVIDYPTLEVQRRTAALLSVWDTAIQKSEQLIAAKERQYTGMVGRLITRGSGAEGSRHVSIRDIADRIQRQGDGGDYPLLTISSASGFIRQEDRYSRYMAGESAKTYTLLRAGEFSYNKGNSKRYEFGCVFQLRNYEAVLVPSVYVSFRLHDSVCTAYMRHLFAVDYLKPQLRALVKTGVRNNGLLNIRPDEFMGTTVPLPSLRKQTRIANVLDAASAEIDLQRQQLAALRTQKRGLMQKLLTGQWRLPALYVTEVPADA